MKSFEVKKLAPGSVFKTVAYFMLLPALICIMIGLVMFLIGIMTDSPQVTFMAALLTFIYPVLIFGLYGGLSVLEALIYNICARKFGGLKMSIEEDAGENSEV